MLSMLRGPDGTLMPVGELALIGGGLWPEPLDVDEETRDFGPVGAPTGDIEPAEGLAIPDPDPFALFACCFWLPR